MVGNGSDHDDEDEDAGSYDNYDDDEDEDAVASTEFIAKKKEFQDLKKSDRRKQISLVISNYLIEAAND